MKLKTGIESNFRKLFFFSLTMRRHFISILAIYYMTLPDSSAKQVGFFWAAGALATFIIEIPSGYFADIFGHKKTLILSKIFLIFSSLFFAFGNSFWLFLLGSVLMSIGFAFSSGAYSAFLHDTLMDLHRDKDYTKISSKISANVSLACVILLIVIPALSKISINLPIIINIFIDIIGLIVTLSLVNPKKHIETSKESIFKTIKNLSRTGFWPLSLFIGFIGGTFLTLSSFRNLHIESLGLPIYLIGIVFAISRFVWFVTGHYAGQIRKKISLKKLMLFELILFPSTFYLTSIIKNPYVVSLIFVLPLGYYWGRREIYTHYILDKCMKNPKYKATILSVNQQVASLINFIIVIPIGYIMDISYAKGFFVISIVLASALSILYITNLINKNSIIN